MSKSLFNFYLDDEVKKQANDKLNNMFGEQSKGMLAAYLRVSVNKLINEEIDAQLAIDIFNEFEYSKIKNKRSRLWVTFLKWLDTIIRM